MSHADMVSDEGDQGLVIRSDGYSACAARRDGMSDPQMRSFLHIDTPIVAIVWDGELFERFVEEKNAH